MPIAPGMRLGPYEVIAPLGAGGMGEVYRARDTRLDRAVAVKVLPDAFANDAERLARFQREAQVLASLNHSNIAAIYGLEESGGVRALVMELVEGPTLGDRISDGAIPWDDAVPIAQQIAEALEYAHERGIVHRDLKPANVKVTPEGKVKVLDFGLAKAMSEDPQGQHPANSPTLSWAATKSGVILGTAAYMSPEQARGTTVDRRADIWAFGAVLFEVLTGTRLINEATASDALAAVLKSDLNFGALPDATPPRIRRLIERCLKRDPKLRLRDIGEARIILDSPEEQTVAPTPLGSSRPWGWIAATGVLAATLAVAGIALWRATRPVSRPLLRFSAELGADVSLETGSSSVILSPDGSRLAFVGVASDSKRHLYARLLDQSHATQLAGTDGAGDPFFSPDGQWIGFFAEGKLKKISVQGGAAVTLCDASGVRGGSWGENGQIVFALVAGGLAQAPAAGGAPTPLTELDKGKTENTHRWPQVISRAGAGDQVVLFTAGNSMGFEYASIEVLSLKTHQRKTLLRSGTHGRYGAGHLVYAHQGALFAAPMDLDRLELTGPATPLVEEVVSDVRTGVAQFAFSQNGEFVFVAGKTSGAAIVGWLDSSGKTQPLRDVPGAYTTPRFSPDGKRLAMTVIEGSNWDIWVYDLERDTMSRLTVRPEEDSFPVWAPDGKHIVFQSSRGGVVSNLYWIRSDGAGQAIRLTESKNSQTPVSFSPDGKRLAFTENTPESGFDIFTLPLDLNDPEHPKTSKAEPFLRTPASEVRPAFSPDGRWLAYSSNESESSRTFEVYVRPFPGPGGKWQISTGGGGLPVWSPNGKELFYRASDGRIMVANYSAKGDTFQADKPKLWSQKQLFAQGNYPNFDLAPDGKRFAVLLAPDGTEAKPPNHLTFLLNFFDELQRKAPGKN